MKISAGVLWFLIIQGFVVVEATSQNLPGQSVPMNSISAASEYPNRSTPAGNHSKVSVIARNTDEVYQLEKDLLQNPEYPGMIGIRVSQIAAIQSLIPKNVSIVMYYPAATRLYVFVASKKAFIAKSVAVSRERLYNMIRQYRQIIQDDVHNLTRANKSRNWYKSLTIQTWQEAWVRPLKILTTRLHHLLIKPIKNEIDSEKMVIFISAGLLYYLPLQALAEEKDGQLRFVLEDWEIAYQTSTTFINSIIRGANNHLAADVCHAKILAVGNSSGRLRGVDNEMISLKQFAPQALIYLNKQATEERVKNHFHHCCILIISDYFNPEGGYFQLAPTPNEDGQFHIREIETRRTSTLDLVILPVYTEQYPAIMNLANARNIVMAFSQVGASSIITSMLPVSDRDTPELMHHFYKNYFQLKLDKANSLRLAQLALLKNPETRHPFFWAGFMLYGYWPVEPIEQTTR